MIPISNHSEKPLDKQFPISDEDIYEIDVEITSVDETPLTELTGHTAVACPPTITCIRRCRMTPITCMRCPHG